MLTSAERRFIKYWIEQREGGRRSYFLLYISVGTFFFTLVWSVFLFLFFNIVFGSLFFWLAFGSGLICSTITTLVTWRRNEKKFHLLVRKIRDYMKEKEKAPNNGTKTSKDPQR